MVSLLGWACWLGPVFKWVFWVGSLIRWTCWLFSTVRWGLSWILQSSLVGQVCRLCSLAGWCHCLYSTVGQGWGPWSMITPGWVGSQAVFPWLDGSTGLTWCSGRDVGWASWSDVASGCAPKVPGDSGWALQLSKPIGCVLSLFEVTVQAFWLGRTCHCTPQLGGARDCVKQLSRAIC